MTNIYYLTVLEAGNLKYRELQRWYLKRTEREFVLCFSSSLMEERSFWQSLDVYESVAQIFSLMFMCDVLPIWKMSPLGVIILFFIEDKLGHIAVQSFFLLLCWGIIPVAIWDTLCSAEDWTQFSCKINVFSLVLSLGLKMFSFFALERQYRG